MSLKDLPQGGPELWHRSRILVVEYHIGYTKTAFHMAEKQVCYRGHSELPFTYKNQDKLDPFFQLIHTSRDAIEGPTKQQISNKVHQPYIEAPSWVINQLQQTIRGRGKILLLLVNTKPKNKDRDIT